jgi:hypothetical protein
MSRASVAACSLSHTGKAATSKPGRPASASGDGCACPIVDRYRDETSAPERLLTCRQISDPDRLTAYNLTPADGGRTRRLLSALGACIYSPSVLR